MAPPKATKQGDGYVVSNCGQQVLYPKYSHHPLSSKRSIRLLRLDLSLQTSVNQQSTLKRYFLEECSIDDPQLKYTAVSYVWGDANEHAPVLICTSTGTAVHLTTPNAWEAIDALGDNSLLWLDQVCIDQRNLDETASQINLMKDIYSRCSECAVWLGPDDPDRKVAIDFVNLLEQPFPISVIIPIDARRLLALPHDDIRQLFEVHYGEDRLPPDDDPGWVALARCLCNPWFERLWTFQEASLPHVDAVKIRSGQSYTTLREMVRASWFLGLWDLDGIDYNQGKLALSFTMAFHRHTQEGDPVSLLYMLDVTADRECKYPRDRIYGLLGLHSENMEAIAVDLTKSDQQLYKEVAKKWIEANSSLIICSLAPERFNGQVTELPSWVPDWTAGDDRAPKLEHLQRPYLYAADRNRPLRVQYEEQSNILVTRGNAVDYIIELLDVELLGDASIEEWMTCLRSTLPRLFDILRPFFILDSSALKLRIVQTFTQGGALARDGAYPDLRLQSATTRMWIDRLFEPMAVSTPHIGRDVGFDAWVREFVMQGTCCARRRIARLSENLLGLVPAHAQVGDFLAVLHGLSIPALLRPVALGRYRLVGTCYVEGIMFGEAATWAEEEAREIRLV